MPEGEIWSIKLFLFVLRSIIQQNIKVKKARSYPGFTAFI